MERLRLLIGRMLYVIRYDTWTVEETDVHSLQDPKFETELEAEGYIFKELGRLIDFHHLSNSQLYPFYMNKWMACKQRIQKLKQQSI